MTSELFDDTFVDAGSLVVTCDFCGITRFCRDHLEKGELEELLELQKEKPTLYIECTSGNDMVAWGMLGGKTFIPGCCGYADGIEEFVWRDRRRIIEYFRERMRKNLSTAQADWALVSQISGEKKA